MREPHILFESSNVTLHGDVKSKEWGGGWGRWEPSRFPVKGASAFCNNSVYISAVFETKTHQSVLIFRDV